jgi:predicted peptidase
MRHLEGKSTELYEDLRENTVAGGGRKILPVFFRILLILSSLFVLVAMPAHAKKQETGFLDRVITIHEVQYKYQVFIPEDWTPHQKWPVILFLHGAGERGSDGLMQTDVGIGTAIRTSRSLIEAIVVMPQCPKSLWWMLPPMDELAVATLDQATKEFHGDAQRTYLTGLSMGGYGAWHLAQKYPGKFAAMIVICGGIRPRASVLKAYPDLNQVILPDSPNSYAAAADRIGKVPVWIFHGSADDIVPVTESQRMYQAMKQVGAEAHYIEYPGVGHACWNKAYDEPKLFPWLFSKSLSTETR